MGNLHKLKELTGREWLYLSSALGLLPLLRLSLNLWGFQRVLTTLKSLAPLPFDTSRQAVAKAPATLTDADIASLVRMVNIAATRSPIKANCLPRSLAIWWLLRRNGVDGELRLGVKPRDQDLQAHAWVECHGRVLNDEADIGKQFAAFERVGLDQGSR